MGIRGPQKGAKYKPKPPKPSVDLEDARWVAEHPYDETKVPMRLELQGLFVEDFKTFLARKDRLEARYAAQLAGQVPGPSGEQKCSPERDEGSDRAEELIERLLAEAGEQ